MVTWLPCNFCLLYGSHGPFIYIYRYRYRYRWFCPFSKKGWCSTTILYNSRRVTWNENIEFIDGYVWTFSRHSYGMAFGYLKRQSHLWRQVATKLPSSSLSLEFGEILDIHPSIASQASQASQARYSSRRSQVGLVLWWVKDLRETTSQKNHRKNSVGQATPGAAVPFDGSKVKRFVSLNVDWECAHFWEFFTWVSCLEADKYSMEALFWRCTGAIQPVFASRNIMIRYFHKIAAQKWFDLLVEKRADWPQKLSWNGFGAHIPSFFLFHLTMDNDPFSKSIIYNDIPIEHEVFHSFGRSFLRCLVIPGPSHEKTCLFQQHRGLWARCVLFFWTTAHIYIFSCFIIKIFPRNIVSTQTASSWRSIQFGPHLIYPKKITWSK